MGTERGRKLNWLQHRLPEGLLVDAAWLRRHGYSYALVRKYLAKGWLQQPTRAVYRRPPAQLDDDRPGQDALTWPQVVISLQTLLHLPVIVGGRTALELQGFAHYLSPTGPTEIQLYAHKDLPGWFSRLTLTAARFVVHNARALFRDQLIVPSEAALSQRLPPDAVEKHLEQAGLIRQRWSNWDWPMLMSSPERAILEWIDMLPNKESFHQVDVVMEGLRTISPKKMRSVLQDCRSIKVKRLFFWFAERHNHAWLPRIDRERIDLGKGKRLIVRGGKLDPTYNITVPDDLDAGG